LLLLNVEGLLVRRSPPDEAFSENLSVPSPKPAPGVNPVSCFPRSRLSSPLPKKRTIFYPCFVPFNFATLNVPPPEGGFGSLFTNLLVKETPKDFLFLQLYRCRH